MRTDAAEDEDLAFHGLNVAGNVQTAVCDHAVLQDAHVVLVRRELVPVSRLAVVRAGPVLLLQLALERRERQRGAAVEHLEPAILLMVHDERHTQLWVGEAARQRHLGQGVELEARDVLCLVANHCSHWRLSGKVFPGAHG